MNNDWEEACDCPEEIFYDLMKEDLSVEAFQEIRYRVGFDSLAEFIRYTARQNKDLLVDFLFGANFIDEEASRELLKHLKCEDIKFVYNITICFMCKSAVDILFNICGDNLPKDIVSALYIPYYKNDESYHYFLRKFRKSWKIKLMEEEDRANLILLLNDNYLLQYDNPYVFLFLRGYTSQVDPIIDRFIDLFEKLNEIHNVMDSVSQVRSNNPIAQTAVEIAYSNLELQEREICKKLEEIVEDIPDLEEFLSGPDESQF